ncbi:MAG: tetratricopeptide repeat protein [Candidatus Sulfopaludibacter sp.]|nr:tetratricopeptide repeat protein [Candidatus Sulfopaludibacter sp.]
MTATACFTVADALACHRAGRLEEAEWMYGSVLERDPGNPDAWHLMGRLAWQRGDARAAAARVLQAIRYRPAVPAYHTSLGEILAAQHRHPEAAACYREALRRDPQYVPALVGLGNLLASQELYREACTYYWQAIRLRPECAEAFCNLGNALRAQGEVEEAVACYREACVLRPENAANAVNLAAGLIQAQQHAEAEQWARRAVGLRPDLCEGLSNLAVALQGQQRLTEAEPFARQALERAPGAAHLHLNLGSLLLELGRFAEAEAELRRALRIRPDYPQAANNLAVALHQQDRNDEASAWCEELLHSLPQFGEVWANLGIVRQAQGRNREAILCFDEALRRGPEDHKSHVCRSLSLLAEGRFAEGFEEYEWRWKMLPEAPRARSLPAWDGSALAGRTILLWAEQGLGDTLQFARYAPLVAARGGHVMVEAQDCLVSLVGSIDGAGEVVAQSGELPRCDLQAPLLSLPRLLGTTVDTIPGAIPYVYAEAARVRAYRARWEPGRGFRVGLVWAGSPRHVSDRLRSIPLSRMAALRNVAGVEWHSLQVEEHAREEARREAGWLHPGLDEPDADSLAAAMSCLDLVITVDTMPAHLAGALGRPVWVLLAHVPDWRWQIAEEDSPWYPTMRLFRQQRAGDWEELVERIAGEVGRLASDFRRRDR